MDKQTQPHVIKKQQQLNLLMIIGIGIAIFVVLYYSFKASHLDHEQSRKNLTYSFASPLDHIDAQSVWLERAQNQLLAQNKSQTAFKQQIESLKKNSNSQDQYTEQQQKQIQELNNKFEKLQLLLQQQDINNSKTQQKSELLATNNNRNAVGDGFINDDTLQLTTIQSDSVFIPEKNPDSFVPAGTFVRAIVIGGADASAGVTSQVNPTPMLFRILDQGTLPNHQTSHLKDCLATAAAMGDISAERGEIRLERLSCTKPNGEIMELPVEATVFGPDGKNGVRGIPLWREGALLERAFAAGALSGLSHGIAQAYTSNALTPFGTVQTIDNNKIAQFGLANGIGNAAEKLADYNIQRAEQYHPVIQLSAGVVVDIVFLKGFFLESDNHSDHSKNFSFVANNAINMSGLISNPSDSEKNSAGLLPLTPRQIASLKQKVTDQGIE